MSELGITSLWESLRDTGLPEVMLYLSDGGAYRCHWDDTVMLGDTRVALLGDQDRGIVRIIPVEACIGLGVPSPKGVDPLGYRSVVREKVIESSTSAIRVGPGDSNSWEDVRYLREPL